MISIAPNSEIYIAIEPVDFRNGINGLGKICRLHLKKDPQGGAIFVFKNKKRTTLKILYYDGEAFWMIIRRLSQGKIKWWPTKYGKITSLKVKELQTLIMNGNPETADFSDDWKRLIY